MGACRRQSHSKPSVGHHVLWRDLAVSQAQVVPLSLRAHSASCMPRAALRIAMVPLWSLGSRWRYMMASLLAVSPLWHPSARWACGLRAHSRQWFQRRGMSSVMAGAAHWSFWTHAMTAAAWIPAMGCLGPCLRQNQCVMPEPNLRGAQPAADTNRWAALFYHHADVAWREADLRRIEKHSGNVGVPVLPTEIARGNSTQIVHPGTGFLP